MVRPVLDQAVDTVIRRCLGVKAREQIVIVSDTGTRAIGDALREGAERAGAEPVLTVMEPRAENGEEPPAAVAAALESASVFVAPTSKSLSHTQARKAATDNGARGATLPGVTEDMLARLMACDFETLQERSAHLARLLTEADAAHVTCPRGTDLLLDLTGRAGLADDGDLTAPGAFGNLPCGEGFISPLGGSGTMVATSIAGIGLTEAALTVQDGRLVAGEPLLGRLLAAGEQGPNLAELGIGTNEKATLTGNVLEDEKILGTVHVAFGASAGIGGTVSVPVHLDCLISDATLTIGDTPVIESGKFLL